LANQWSLFLYFPNFFLQNLHFIFLPVVLFFIFKIFRKRFIVGNTLIESIFTKQHFYCLILTFYYYLTLKDRRREMWLPRKIFFFEILHRIEIWNIIFSVKFGLILVKSFDEEVIGKFDSDPVSINNKVWPPKISWRSFWPLQNHCFQIFQNFLLTPENSWYIVDPNRSVRVKIIHKLIIVLKCKSFFWSIIRFWRCHLILDSDTSRSPEKNRLFLQFYYKILNLKKKYNALLNCQNHFIAIFLMCLFKVYPYGYLNR